MEQAIVLLAWWGVELTFYQLNQWLVDRKKLDHRPYYVPSLWGPLGTAIILLAEPRGLSPLHISEPVPSAADS